MLEALRECQEALDVLAEDVAGAGYHTRGYRAAELATKVRAILRDVEGGQR